MACLSCLGLSRHRNLSSRFCTGKIVRFWGVLKEKIGLDCQNIMSVEIG
jgi:hypothetical protein